MCKTNPLLPALLSSLGLFQRSYHTPRPPNKAVEATAISHQFRFAVQPAAASPLNVRRTKECSLCPPFFDCYRHAPGAWEDVVDDVLPLGIQHVEEPADYPLRLRAPESPL